MAKRKLKDKIEISIFWLGLFCLTYLIFGFILKSDLTKPIDSSIFYEVLKDALTITTALFAPIAALILFSDWRVEHRLKETFQLLEDIKNLSFSIQNGIGHYHAKIIKEKENNSKKFVNREDRQLILKQTIELERMYDQFLVSNKEIESFKELVINFNKYANKALDQLHMMEYFSFSLNNELHFNDNNYNRANYLKNSELYDETFPKICNRVKEINSQVTCLKVSM
ncbi:hypothetical protein [Acinetobacter baumannii]|uniref:hypothetical protein n=1 Tax=Acinetobacter baumannii TaxID=470 RepID=UPI001900DC8D|nr:hypothetical protein [Acinetobacter baumannii]MBJ9578075.1 hypothetical protein [Acinetobacter baumannii]MDC4273497.1 hypothetical protein [Acinetobacter baumannii]